MTRYLTIIVLIFILPSLCYSQAITVTFTNPGNIEKRTKVYSGQYIIGEVADMWLNKNADTVFVKIKLKKGIRVPVGSEIVIQERLLGNNKVEIRYSTNNNSYSSKDIITGQYKNFKPQSKSPQAINLITRFPIVQMEGQLFNLDDILTIAFCGRLF